MDRRQFLKYGSLFTTTALASGLTTTLSGCVVDLPPLATGKNWKFPQSIASADPRPDSVVVWTRVVNSALSDVALVPTGTDVTIGLRISSSDDNAALLGGNSALRGRMVAELPVPAYADFDGTARHKVTGLEPGKTYYYQFFAGSVRSNVGRFKTAPAKQTDVSQLKFAFVTCQDWSINHWGGYSELVKNDDLDFFIHLGDYIYETVGEAFQTGLVESRHTALSLPDGAYKNGSSGAKYATTLADYRYLYKQYRTDSRLQAMHERFAMIAIWDDHEFSDDCWQDAETYDNGTFNGVTGDNTHQKSRRLSANQAWYEFMPADVKYDDKATDINGIQIYRDFQFGKLAHLVMTDERLYRADHLIPEAAPNPLSGQQLGSIGARYMVPAATLATVEAAKIAAAGGNLALVSMLGNTQRAWWQDTMSNATATWKLWGNEVSLLRMGLNGADAIATLLALNSIGTLATNIGNTAATATGGNVPVAATIVAAVTAGADQAAAGAAGMAIATADAMSTDPLAAAVGAGLAPTQAGIAVACYNAAKAAAAGGMAAQVGAAAQTLAFGYIKPDVQANKQNSPFVIASGKQAALAPYFAKFLLNCDQWDGYNGERKALMQHLRSNNIQNVVALTGDIHSFFAGTVNDDFDANGGGTPTMVDLVTAGMSSDSFFSYLRDAVGSLSTDLATLVYYPLSIPTGTALGTLNITFDLLDYTMGQSAPTLDLLAEQARVQVRGALAQAGAPEAQLDGLTAQLLAGLKANPAFNTQLLGLAQLLSGLNSNPWLKYARTDAQGFAVVTLTPGNLSCQFNQVNRLVGSNAPSTSVIARTTTATVNKDVVGVTIS
ncbi:MAG: alkaline phosphatase D family protein [Burkholderiales bacterium]|nr:alkaline phosphatase D family protein [Burkholderiales bacterium]